MSHLIARIIPVLTAVGLVEAAIFLVGLLAALVLWLQGVIPALWRLGNGLARRQVAVFAKGDNLASLRSLLRDSKLIRAKNILDIASTKDVGRSDKATLYLVYWPDWSGHIDEILRRKPDAAALVVYAPYDHGRLSEADMTKLDGHRNTAITNFRGRLLNDVVTAMITTNYKQ